MNPREDTALYIRHHTVGFGRQVFLSVEEQYRDGALVKVWPPRLDIETGSDLTLDETRELATNVRAAVELMEAIITE